MSRARILGGGLAAAISLCAPLGCYVEGVIPHTYADPVGIPTVCVGETQGVKWTDSYTLPQCISRYETRLKVRWDQVSRCIFHDVTEYEAASILSFSDNVGVAAFCGSTMAHMLNADAPPNIWCAQMNRWKYATAFGVRIVLNGLVKRRGLEYDLCMGHPHSFPMFATADNS